MKALPIAMALLGFIAGIAAGFIIYEFKSYGGERDFQKNLEKALEEINRRIKVSYPDIGARVKSYASAGEFYEIEIEFFDKNGTISVEKYYISMDGKKIVPASQMISLERIRVSEDDDPWLGKKDAKVVIVVFSDYACPHCANFALEAEKRIIENYGNAVKLVFRNFPVHGEISYKAAEAANCAREQGKFWEYHYLLFERQEEWRRGNDSKFYDYAMELNLDFDKFRECLESRKYREEVEKDFRDGVSYGVRGVPTFFINDDIIVGYKSYEEFAKLIEERIK